MEIIKRGKRAASRNVALSCDDCGTRFRCAIGEMRLMPDFRDGDYYEVACPECRKSVTYSADLVRDGGYHGPG